MVEEIIKGIYRIHVPLPNNPLKELNSYFIRGDYRDLLIDTGFRCNECHDALLSSLQELHSDPDRRDVLVTHLHSDHSGMADLFSGKHCHIYISETDHTFLNQLLSEDFFLIRDVRFLSEGFPEKELGYVFSNNPERLFALPVMDHRFYDLHDGDVLHVGEYSLQTILTPGHTPGHSVFWLEKQRLLFSGDHILFDITPNITSWVGIEDSLGDYLYSLHAIKSLPVEITLPGHRETGDYQMRLNELIMHHSARLAEVQQIIRSYPGLTAYEITSQMTWQIRAKNWAEFPPVQKMFAVGECFAHLDYLFMRGIIQKQLQAGVWIYYVS